VPLLTFKTKTNLAFALALLAVAIFGLLSIREIVRMVGAEQWVSHTREVLETSASLSSHLSDAVAARSGFLLAGDPQEASRFVQASDATLADLSKLREIATNASQKDRVRALDPLIRARISILKRSVELRQSAGLKNYADAQAAISMQDVDLGARIMSLQREFHDAESELLIQRMNIATVAVRRTLEIETALAVSLFALLIAAIVSINRENSLREKAQRASKDAANLLRSVLDSSGDAIMACDCHGKVILRNAIMSRFHADVPLDPPMEDWPRLFGLYHRDKKTLLPAKELPLIRAAIHGESVDNVELYIRPPGSEDGRWHLASSRPLLDARGLPRGGIVVSRDINERKMLEEDRDRLITELYTSLANIKTLTGLLPMCAKCKKIRNDEGYWTQVEDFIGLHSDATFTHGLCPDCVARLYPEVPKKTTR
jgi:CHASE3 domain sensor protein